MSLIPEKPIVLSPTLAATIGLEEAVLLQLLQECKSHGESTQSGGFDWVSVQGSKLLTLAPFWQEQDIKRLASSLHEKGLLLIGGGPFSTHGVFRFAFNEGVASRPAKTDIPAKPSSPAAGHSAKTISGSWQPSEDALRQLSQLGVTREFALQQVPQFVTYWRERSVSRHSWESKYIQEVWRQWQRSEATNHQRKREIPMSGEWRPSRDALNILTQQGGINANFVEDAIPEFILYWRDRGDLSSTWDSKFIQHIRRQWHYYCGVMEQDTIPRAMTQGWQPKEAVYDVLRLANINRPFAEQLIPEFVLYWQENGTPQSSWSTKFLQFVKRQWARENNAQAVDSTDGRQQETHRTGRIRDRSIVDALTDRSWAS